MNIRYVLRSREFAIAMICLILIAAFALARVVERAPSIRHLMVAEDIALHIDGDFGVVIDCTRGTLVVDQDIQQPLVLLCETRDDIEYTHASPR